MPKMGIEHDYDLMANHEPAAAKQPTCFVCQKPITYRWSDYHGEAMCCECGTPYQLKGGGAKMEADGKYPCLNLRDEWVPIVREYHKATGKFVYLGSQFGGEPEGYRDFIEWVEANHPEMKKRDNAESTKEDA